MKYLLIIIVALSASYCGPARVGTNPDPIQNEEQILLLDRSFKSRLKVVSQKQRRLESGQLEVIMEVQNKSNKDIWADVQTIFKDATGIEVDKTNWEPKMFHRREVTTFKKVSLTPHATKFRLAIREPKNEG